MYNNATATSSLTDTLFQQNSPFHDLHEYLQLPAPELTTADFWALLRQSNVPEHYSTKPATHWNLTNYCWASVTKKCGLSMPGKSAFSIHILLSFAIVQLQNSTKCHLNRPGKTRIRSVKGILALFCYILTFSSWEFRRLVLFCPCEY